MTGGSARHDGDGVVPEVVAPRGRTALHELAGPTDSLSAPTLAQPPSWMADVIAQRRDYEELYARYMRYVRWRRRIPFVGGPARRA